MEIVYKKDKAEYELELRINDQDATLRDLLRVLAPARARSAAVVHVEGEPVAADTLLRESGLYVGATITVGVEDSGSEPPQRIFELKVVAGPLSGERYPVEVGTSVVGREESCDVVLSDPGVSAKQALVDITADGSGRIKRLGRAPMLVDGVAVGEGASSLMRPGSSLQIGRLHMVLAASEHAQLSAGTQKPVVTAGGTIPFNRPPRRRMPTAPEPLEVPVPPNDRERPPLNLLALMLTAATPAMMALIYKKASMLAFSAVSPVIGIANWYESRRGHLKRERSERGRYEGKVVELREQLDSVFHSEQAQRRDAFPDLTILARRAFDGGTELWERRSGHDDFLALALGLGDVAWDPLLGPNPGVLLPPELEDTVSQYRKLAGVPLTVDLGKNTVLGVYGERDDALALARGLVCQAAVLTGPADMAIAVLTDEARYLGWEWAKWLPHVINATAVTTPRRLIAAKAEQLSAVLKVLATAEPRAGLEGSRSRATLVVVDTDVPRFRGAEAEQVRGVLRGEGGPVAGLVLAQSRRELLGLCSTVVNAGPIAVRVEDPDAHAGSQECSPWGMSARMARRVSRALARFEDVELPEAGGGLPDDVRVISLLGLEGFDPASVR
ncbi:MAG TPA: FHA domain-containing protein, partial [Acidimicrobiales bacterium]|nr:FHA domain-containing protein [Acidimicrobiales bacterium]